MAEIKVTAEQTGGLLSIIEITEPPNAEGPWHVHHREDEGFWILDGDVTLQIGEATIDAHAGDFAFGPRGIPHRYTVGDAGCRMLFIMTPGGFENLVRDMSIQRGAAPSRHLQTKSQTGRTSPRSPRQTVASCSADDTPTKARPRRLSPRYTTAQPRTVASEEFDPLGRGEAAPRRRRMFTRPTPRSRQNADATPKRVLTTVVVALLAAATAATAGVAGPPEKTCPPGFNLGALTLQQRLQLPKVQAALADGIVTLERIQAGAAAIDQNENGLLCVQDIPQANNAAPAAGFEYFYNLSDDNAAARR